MKNLKLMSIFLILGLFIACEPSPEISPHAGGDSELNAFPNSSHNTPERLKPDVAEKNAGLATLRRATAKYHNVDKAIEDGFVPIGPCQENPNGPGGLGIPFVKLDRVDGTINLEEPEVLFYEPQKNGKLRLIGAEPVIPIGLWEGEEPPSMFGHEFHRNDEEGLYGLHMWVWKHNPDGIFSFWHADVSCEFEE